MTSPTAQAMFEQACITRLMAEFVEKFLAGSVTRDQLLAWARAINQDGQRIQFHNPRADSLLTCLCSLDASIGTTGTPIVRNSDLAAHLRDLRIGSRFPVSVTVPLVATVQLAPAEVAQRTCSEVVRFWWDGLGWFEEVCFASSATGTAFRALAPLVATGATQVNVAVINEPAHAANTQGLVLIDLFDALRIDGDDASRHRVVGLDLTVGQLPHHVEQAFGNEDLATPRRCRLEGEMIDAKHI